MCHYIRRKEKGGLCTRATYPTQTIRIESEELAMRKKCKKIVAGFLGVVIALSLLLPVSASALQTVDYDAYAISAAKGYTQMCEITEECAYLSQDYEIENSLNTGNRVYFLFDGEECIGRIIVAFINNEFSSNFIQEKLPAISDLYRDGIPFKVVALDESLLIQTAEETILFDGPEMEGQIDLANTGGNFKLLRLTTFDICQDEENNVATYDSYGSNLTSGYGILEVPYVKNANINGEGICWAATVASIAAYRKQQAALTSVKLFNILDAKFLGTPSGTRTWIGRAFDYYGLEYNYLKKGSNYDSVKTRIQNNRPIYASLKTADGENAHAVVICGYQAYNGGYHYYILMDPNRPQKVTVQIPSSTATTFTYASGEHTYTNWYRQFS